LRSIENFLCDDKFFIEKLETPLLCGGVVHNPEKELQDRNALYAHTTWFKENIEAGKILSGFEEDIEKYLEVYDYGKGATVTIRQDIIDEELETSGWMVIIGNENISAQSAHVPQKRCR